jgi:hypothetical protein
MMWNTPPPSVEVWFVVDIQDTCGNASIAGSFNAWNAVPMTLKPGTNSTFMFTAHVQPNVGIRYGFIKCPGTDARAWEDFEPVTEDCTGNSCYGYGLVSTTSAAGITTVRFLGIGAERHIGWYGQEPMTFGQPDPSTDITFSVAADPACGAVALAGTFNAWTRTAMTSDGAGVYSVTVPLRPGRPVDYMYVTCPGTNASEWEDFEDVSELYSETERVCSGVPGTEGYACFAGGTLSYTIGGLVTTTRTLYYGAGSTQLDSLVLPVDTFSVQSEDIRLSLSVDIADDCGSAQYAGSTSHWEPVNMTLTSGSTYSIDIMARPGVPVVYAFMRCEGEWEELPAVRELEVGDQEVGPQNLDRSVPTASWGVVDSGR